MGATPLATTKTKAAKRKRLGYGTSLKGPAAKVYVRKPLKSYVVRVDSDALYQEVLAFLEGRPTVRIKYELPARRAVSIETRAGNRLLPALLRDKGASVRVEQHYSPE